ncbi:ATPase family AAA domain-containing protein 5b [Scleropages formosus]|uniref:ATPase family AAA domain-containing protein 5b n=1 Tax=Scleropages formosus TaxID=113540 RepID=UPI000878645B|nr:ATPase family AAA domain-containing protein 5 [Scleropages formosus]
MASLVAMASVTEDFETQPCKKERKDGETSSVKTITNYFQPVPKPTEKPFSPPKPNNILDYFRKTGSTLEKTDISDLAKENRKSPSELQDCRETAVKSVKIGRLKRSKRLSKKLSFSRGAKDLETEGPSEVIRVSESDFSSDGQLSVGDMKRSSTVFGSDTATFLAQISTEAIDGQESLHDETFIVTDTCSEKKPQENSDRKGSVNQKAKSLLDTTASLESTKSGGKKSKYTKADCKPDAVLPKQDLLKAQEPDRSLSDRNLEANVDKASPLNDSTVTISFEEFLQSQNQDDGSSSFDTSDHINEVSNTTSEEFSSQKVSPRTLTIQAEVHPVSPEHEMVNPRMRQLASIFTRRLVQSGKGSNSKSPSHPWEDADIQPTPKRKSNVVLQEEDLVLAVIEAGSTPKCTQTERKQFMNAFKQPTLEAGKAKLRKGPSKQEAANNKTVMLPEEETLTCKKVSKEEKAQLEDVLFRKKGHNKLQRGGKKKAGEESPLLLPASEEKAVSEGGGKAECPDTAGDHTIAPVETTALRRSTRGRAQEMTSEQSTPTQSPMTRSCNRLKNQQKGKEPSQGSLTVTATPKRHLSKHRMYRVEMLSPPDGNSSPIRMRFQYVSEQKSGDASDFEIQSPLVIQKSGPSKSRKQAKKLVEKAKALQQNKNAAAADNKCTLRRSTRSANLQRNSHSDNKDSVVCLEEKQEGSSPTVNKKVKGQKQLRTLNEVLGKKATKGSIVSKIAPVFLGKKMQKPAAVISIFDESSCDWSENSQDDEHFRARREFLKSGLPESFKKQIARTAASRDAYSTACTSFQPVVHVLQRSPGCPLWNLPWPGSLKQLEKARFDVSKPVLSLGQTHYTKTQPTSRANINKGTGWREEFSEPVRKCLVEEVRASNPQFPVQKFLAWFLKRRAEHLLQCAVSEPDKSHKAVSTPALPEPAGRKRKRGSQNDGKVGGTKRRRSSRGDPIVIEDNSAKEDATSIGSRLSRSRTQRKQETGGLVSGSTPVQNCSAIVLDDSLPPPENFQKGGFMKEDVLWTEKYQPQHSSEVIGNMAAVRKLHSWLKEWKQRADSEEGRNQRDKKRGDNSNDSWDCGDFQGEEALEIGEDPLCNTLLITGPPGVGKTAAVYACAQELGFKVFEVNASSQRSGRQILSQLKEATQSHQVDLQGVGALKPSYFNSQSNSSTRSGTSPRKGNSPGKVVSSPRKVPQSPRRTGHKKNRLAPVSLVSFFKTGSLKEKNPGGEDSCPQKDTSTCSVRPKTKESIIKGKENTNKSLTDKEEVSAEEQSKKTATSLILFEEVDVIFEEDSGFLAAIKTFMTTTKRPVILTTSDPIFSIMFDGSFEEINFKMPSVVNVGSYLQLLCLAENVRVDAQDLFSLLAWKKCDIRQSMLHLQFWVCSGGGRPSAQRLLAPASDIRDDEGVSELTGEAEKPTEEKGSAADPPHCQTGCTESLLGLLNIGSDLDPQEVCKCKSSAEPETQKCWKLLTDSWKRGVDLLYTNMEELLPLPVCILETCSRGPQEAPKQSSLQHHVEVCELSDEASPTKVSSRIRRKRCLSHTDQATPVLDSDTDDDFLSLPKSTQAATISKPEETSDMSTRVLLKHSEEKPPAPEKSSRELNNTELSPEQRRASTLVSCCLESMAEFLDHMSFLDSSLKNQDLEMEGTCRPGALGWIGAEVKSGLTDEPREAHSAGYGQWEEAAEVRAVTESLSFQRCHKEVSEVWVEAQKLEHEVQDKVIERLSLPVALHRKGFSLFESSLCEPRVIQMRGDVLRTTSSRVLSMLGNKPAAAMDYLPSLRTICRSERLKEQGKVKRRFLHYLDGIHLGLPRNTVQILAEDFP